MISFKLSLAIVLLFLELLFSYQGIKVGFLALIPQYILGVIFFLILKQSIKRENKYRNELKEKLIRRDELLSTLSHEVRTPLTVIQSSAEILQQERLGPLNENQINFIETLLDNIQRLISFTDTILSCIKVETDWFPSI